MEKVRVERRNQKRKGVGTEWHSVKRNLFLRLLFGQSWQVSGLLQ
jgi:hypothetical protein